MTERAGTAASRAPLVTRSSEPRGGTFCAGGDCLARARTCSVSRSLIEQRSSSDAESRSRLVYNSIQYSVVRANADGDPVTAGR
ncbi:hypothetical protein Nham_3207 [Nitrobacter hamburgensis X14]|uniref:Uncharacterized protein n=1 Tax=Nitrobacter hamburgensis (strain DSM 10229 / NCIMB 13809 / X14) TaxID=323097 RepID=Q1QIK5_NITHX|nr:hypothetical protein Nham_3207 [Nitrobacter hamburgensis X14]